MAFVLDTSVTLSWCLPDEFSSATDAIYRALPHSFAVVPMLWKYELANILGLAEKKGRITQDQITRFLESLHSFDLRFTDTNVLRLLEVSRQTGLTAYDAAYLDASLTYDLH